MTRETASKNVIKDFTPLFDRLIEEYDLMTAAVFGRVWRYCQMKDGVCYATISKIAQKVGLSYDTALRRLKILCEAGYLIDQDPGLRNAPHRYRLTGKLDLEHVSETRALFDPSSGSQQDEPSDIPPSSGREQDPSSGSQQDEETEETEETYDVGVHTNKEQQQSMTLLTDFNVSGPVAKSLAAHQSLEDVQGWIAYAKRANSLQNPAAFVVSRLQSGEPAPSNGKDPEQAEEEDRRRYLEWVQ